MDIAGKMTMLDDIFSSYLLKNSTQREFCRDASNFLSGISAKSGRPKKISVSIVDNSKCEKEPFFGMRIFPETYEMDKLLNSMLNPENQTVSLKKIVDQWRVIPNWVMEIDSRVFERMSINFNPQELTAMALHEVGHTIYSDRKIEGFYRALRECQIRHDAARRASAKILYFLYMIPLTLACGMKNWSVTSEDLREEIFADQSVQKLGYSEHLISAYEKIIKSYGSSTVISRKENEDSIKSSVTWCELNLTDLVRRKNKLKDELYATGSSTNSSFIRTVVQKIMKALKIRASERYSGNVVMESLSLESFDDPTTFVNENCLEYDKIEFAKLTNAIEAMIRSEKHSVAVATEGFFRRNKKDEVPSQLDVDTIFVEVDRIENHADRRYVLDLIYNQEEKIERFKERFQYDDSLRRKYEHKMEAMLKELASMRQAVLDKRSFDKRYKVFVKCPAGYEG